MGQKGIEKRKKEKRWSERMKRKKYQWRKIGSVTEREKERQSEQKAKEKEWRQEKERNKINQIKAIASGKK